mgnify:CR=1 FL=1
MSRFIYHCPVRWSDLDAYGHVNNSRLLTLYEEARVALFFVGARAKGLTSFEEGIVIARHEVDYLRPVPYRQQVRIEMWVDEIRTARIGIRYELFDEDVLASRARSVAVPYDLAAQRLRRVTDAEREFLTAWLE